VVASLGALLTGLTGLTAQPASASEENPGGILSPALATPEEIFELGADHRVHFVDVRNFPTSDLGGFAVDGVAVAGGRTAPEAVLVHGADGAVWYRQRVNATGWTAWASLGGRTTARPAVAEIGDLLVAVVRGTDGRMYERVGSSAGWSAGWRAVNARFTGALAIGLRSNGMLAVYGRGSDGRLWTATRAGTPDAPWSAFRPVPTRSGLLLDDPAVDPAGGNLFVRGVNGACWTFDPADPAAGWHSLGGRFISGFAAATPPEQALSGARTNGIHPTTVVMGRGLNGLLYELISDHWELFVVV
jgi:hypothetical protein